MPNVAGREFPYTPQGMAAAEQYKQSLGMRNGGTAGFRPLGYRDGGDVEAANDATYSKLQTALDTLKDKEQLNNFIHKNKAALESMAEASSARRETLESIKHFSNFAGYMERIMQEGEEIEELGTGIPQEMYRPGLGDDVEQFFPEANREVLEQMPEFQTNGFYKAEPYRFPINPDTGLPWTDEERGPSRRVPKSGGVNPETGEGYPGIGYHTGDNTGNITSTMEYVPARDMPQDPILKLLRERNEGRGMRNGGMMGFRPVGYQDGDLVEDPYAPSLYQGGIDSSEFLPGGPITPLVATGAGARVAQETLQGAGTAVPYGMRHGGIMSLRRR